MDVDGIGETTNVQNDNFHRDEINAVILHTDDQVDASEQHARTLEANPSQSINPTLISCDDLAWFEEVNVDSFHELHLIVGTAMFANIMKDGHLDKRAENLFKEIERSRKKIYVVDNFPEDLDELFHKLPRKVRRKWKKPKGSGGQTTGVAGGEADKSIAVGKMNGPQTINYGNFISVQTEKQIEVMGRELSEGQSVSLGTQQGQAVDPNMNHLKISIKHNKNEIENDEMLTAVSENGEKLLNGDVKSLKVGKGSVIITLTVDKSFIMTDEWINDVMRVIFNEILDRFIAEGTIFHVNVERFITLSKEEMLKLYIGQQNQTLSKDGCEDKEKQLIKDTSTQTENVDSFTEKQPSKHMSTQTENLDDCTGEQLSMSVANQNTFIEDIEEKRFTKIFSKLRLRQRAELQELQDSWDSLSSTPENLSEDGTTLDPWLLPEFLALKMQSFEKFSQPPQDGSPDSAQATGISGGEANESIVVGSQKGPHTIVYGNAVINVRTGQKFEVIEKEISNEQSISVKQDQAVNPNMNQFKISIKHDKDDIENDKMLREVSQNEVKLLKDNVKEVRVEKGSVIITLTVDKSLIMTDEWIHDVLRTIFHDILGPFIADGTTFHVNVERFITLSKEEMLML